MQPRTMANVRQTLEAKFPQRTWSENAVRRVRAACVAHNVLSCEELAEVLDHVGEVRQAFVDTLGRAQSLDDVMTYAINVWLHGHHSFRMALQGTKEYRLGRALRPKMAEKLAALYEASTWPTPDAKTLDEEVTRLVCQLYTEQNLDLKRAQHLWRRAEEVGFLAKCNAKYQEILGQDIPPFNYLVACVQAPLDGNVDRWVEKHGEGLDPTKPIGW